MNIAIYRKGKEILAIKDYEDINDKGEVAHMIAELGSIILDLQDIWDQLNDPNNKEEL